MSIGSMLSRCQNLTTYQSGIFPRPCGAWPMSSSRTCCSGRCRAFPLRPIGRRIGRFRCGQRGYLVRFERTQTWQILQQQMLLILSARQRLADDWHARGCFHLLRYRRGSFQREACRCGSRDRSDHPRKTHTISKWLPSDCWVS